MENVRHVGAVTALTLFAEYANVAGQTEAAERIEAIHTSGSVPTGVRVTLIKI